MALNTGFFIGLISLRLVQYLVQETGGASASELKAVLSGALPAFMDEKQQAKKVSNILQSMKKDGVANVIGTGHAARWYLERK